MSGFTEGIILIVAAAFLQGTYALFLKFKRHWRWENFWAVFSITALVISPIFIGAILVPNMAVVLSTTPINVLVFPFIFGMLWGVGAVLFGLSVERIGLALTYSLIIGLTATLGSLLPLLLAASLPSQKVLMLFFGGILIMVVGLAVSAYAGMKREIQQKNRGFKFGLLSAVTSGMTSPMLNMGFVYGRGMLESAQAVGISEELSTLPVWIIVLLGGFLINFGYAAYLLLRGKTFTLFVHNTRVPLLLSATSGIVFFSGLAIYGVASSLLDALGTSVGWALLMSLMIVVSNISSIFTGEWKGSRGALRYQLASILILLLGISTMGISFYL